MAITRILVVLAAVLLAFVPATHAAGSTSCPCMTSFPASVSQFRDTSGSLQITLGGTQHLYPGAYGLSTCTAHDTGLSPYCNDANVTTRPAWCFHHWCYVDDANCVLPTSESSYFPGAGLRYSYTTCGATNAFDAWFGNHTNATETVRSLTEMRLSASSRTTCGRQLARSKTRTLSSQAPQVPALSTTLARAKAAPSIRSGRRRRRRHRTTRSRLHTRR
jgi:hypothetical protein